jgi:hypothetical protein
VNWPDNTEHPPAVTELDGQVVKDIHRARWLVLLIVACLLAGAVVGLSLVVVHLNTVISRQRAEILSSCKFYRDLAPLPVVNASNSRWPSEFSVTLIIDARHVYQGESCDGPLPAANPTVIRGARHYGLVVPHS